MRKPTLFGIPLILGILFATACGFSAYKSYQKEISWKEVDGILIESGRSTKFSFDYNGKKINLSSNYSSYLAEGEVIKVFYPNGKPELAEIKSFVPLWILPISFSVFAVLFLGIHLRVPFTLMRKQRKETLY